MANAIESRVMALAEPLCVEQGAELGLDFAFIY